MRSTSISIIRWPGGWPNHPAIRGAVALGVPSFAMTEQVRAISRERLVEPIGTVDDDCLDEVRRWIVDYVAR